MQGLEAKIVVYLPAVRRISVIKNKLEPLRGTPEAIARRMRHDQTLGAGEGVVAMAVDTDADKLERLGGWNREHLWNVASRCLSHLVVFHV